MNLKKLLTSTLIIAILFIFLDAIIGILTFPLYDMQSGVYKAQPNAAAGIIFDLINAFILVIVFHILYKSIPGKGWKKGLNYGLIVGLFRVVMSSFTAIVIYNIPTSTILITTLVSYIEIIILCIALSLIHKNK